MSSLAPLQQLHQHQQQQLREQERLRREDERLRREDPLSYMSSSLNIFSSTKSTDVLLAKEWGGCASEVEEEEVGEAAKRLLEGLSEREKAALLATLSGKEESSTSRDSATQLWGGRGNDDNQPNDRRDEVDDRYSPSSRRNRHRHRSRGRKSSESQSRSRRQWRSRSRSQSRRRSRDHRYKSRHHQRRERNHLRSRSRSSPNHRRNKQSVPSIANLLK